MKKTKIWHLKCHFNLLSKYSDKHSLFFLILFFYFIYCYGKSAFILALSKYIGEQKIKTKNSNECNSVFYNYTIKFHMFVQNTANKKDFSWKRKNNSKIKWKNINETNWNNVVCVCALLLKTNFFKTEFDRSFVIECTIKSIKYKTHFELCMLLHATNCNLQNTIANLNSIRKKYTIY